MFGTFGDSSRHPATAPLYGLAAFLRSAEHLIRASATRLDAWLAGRRTATRARRDLSAMSDWELKDIGITRVDVERVSWGASNRDAP